MTSFRAVVPAVGVDAVQVGGRPVADVRSVVVKAAVGEATKVYLEIAGTGAVEGDGIVHVVAPASRATIADWLATIDPDELEKAALDRMSGLGGGSTGEAMLAVLRGWAGGGS